MPPIRYYEITQTRRVRVSSTNSIDAARVAKDAFDGKAKMSNPDDPHILTEVEEVNLVIWDERFNNAPSSG